MPFRQTHKVSALQSAGKSLARGRGLVHARQLACDLLGRPAASQTVQNRSSKRRLHVATELASGPTGGRASSNASGLCPTGAVACRRRRRAGLGAIDFAAHRGVMKVQLPGDRAATELGCQQGLNRHAIRRGDVRVVRLHLTDTLQGERCRTSNLSRPCTGHCGTPSNRGLTVVETPRQPTSPCHFGDINNPSLQISQPKRKAS